MKTDKNILLFEDIIDLYNKPNFVKFWYWLEEKEETAIGNQTKLYYSKLKSFIAPIPPSERLQIEKEYLRWQLEQEQEQEVYNNDKTSFKNN